MLLVGLLCSLLVTVALCLFSISLWQYYIDSLRDKKSKLPLPPGTVGLPLIGETVHMITQGWNFYKSRRLKYGRIYKTHILGRPTIRFWGTENIRKVLKNEELLVTMSWPDSVVELVGKNSLINSSRRDHIIRRSIVLKAFTAKCMAAYSPIMESIITKHIRKWCNEPNKVMALKECQKMVFEISARVFISYDILREELHDITSNMTYIIQNLFNLPLNIPGTSYHKAMKARSEVIKIIKHIIAKDNSNKSYPSVLSHLMPYIKRGESTEDEVVDAIIEMFVASYNGLTSLCCSALLNLYKHPRATKELLRNLEDFHLLSTSEPINSEVLDRVSYLQFVWKELARSTPPVGGGFRKVLKTFELDGYQIPAGWTLLYSIRDNHTDEDIYAAAEDFNPDRWEDSDNDYNFLMFGGNGIRSCIGKRFTVQLISLFITVLVRDAVWELDDVETELMLFPASLPKTGLPINFRTKKSKNLTH